MDRALERIFIEQTLKDMDLPDDQYEDVIAKWKVAIVEFPDSVFTVTRVVAPAPEDIVLLSMQTEEDHEWLAILWERP